MTSFRVPSLGPAELEIINDSFNGLMGEEIQDRVVKTIPLELIISRRIHPLENYDGKSSREHIKLLKNLNVELAYPIAEKSGIFYRGLGGTDFISPLVDKRIPLTLCVLLQGGYIGYAYRELTMQPGCKLVYSFDGSNVSSCLSMNGKELDLTSYK